MAVESCTTRSPSTITGTRPAFGCGSLSFFGKAPRQGLDVEPLMRKRHARAPTERAETAVRLGAGQVVHRDRHAWLLGLQFIRPHISRRRVSAISGRQI